MYCNSGAGGLCFFFGSCDDHSDDFDDIEFSFDGKSTTYTLTPGQYLRNGEDFGYGGACIFAVQESSTGGYSLGTIFIEKYYTVYDYQNFRIGFSYTKGNFLSGGAIAGIVIGCVVVTAIIIVIVLKCCICKKKALEWGMIILKINKHLIDS